MLFKYYKFRKKIFRFILISSLLSASGNNSQPARCEEVVCAENTSFDIVETREWLLDAHNIERRKVGAPDLKINEWCNRAAQERAEMCVELWSHDWPEGASGDACLYIYSHAEEWGENLLCDDDFSIDFSKDVVYEYVTNSWMLSTMGHKELLLDSEYNYVGFGVAEDEYTGEAYVAVIFVKDFGPPVSFKELNSDTLAWKNHTFEDKIGSENMKKLKSMCAK